MAETLADDARERCQRVIAEYRRWAPDEARAPQVSGRLGGGHSNLSLLLTGRAMRWVLRLSPPERAVGVDRRRELLVHQRAAAAGIAPEVVYHDLAAGVLVTAFIEASADEATHAPCTQPDRRDDPASVATLLRAIHSLDTELSSQREINGVDRLDTPTYLRRWRAGLSRDPLLELDPRSLRALAECTERLDAKASEVCLCHNDLIRANRIDDGRRLLAIDWEYADRGDPFFDLANAAWELDATARGALLRHYLGREADPDEAQRFADQLCMQAAIACCWHAIRDQAGPAGEARDRLREQLRARL